MSQQKKSQIIVVRGALVNDAGKILLIPRINENNNLTHYELPGGKLQFGENPQEALTREFFEETGLEVEVLRPYHAFSVMDQLAENQLRYTLELTFHVGFKDSAQKNIQSLNKDFIWLDKNELKSQPLTVETKERIRQAITAKNY